MTAEWKQRLIQGMKRTGELLLEAGAREVSFTNQAFPLLRSPDELHKLDGFPIEPGLANFISAYIQGTCRMGSNRQNRVVDQGLMLHTGDSIGMDESVMPSSASTHVMLPIMVVADRAIHRMLDA